MSLFKKVFLLSQMPCISLERSCPVREHNSRKELPRERTQFEKGAAPRENTIRTNQVRSTPPLDRRGFVSRVFDNVTPPERDSVSGCVGWPSSKLLSLRLPSSTDPLCVSGRVTVRVSLRGGTSADPAFLTDWNT